MRDSFAIDSGEMLHKLKPLRHRRAGLPAVLEHAAEIDVTRMKIRFQPDAFLKSIDGARPVADRSASTTAKIEIGRMQQAVAGIVSNPGLV